ncbi:Toll/interleukin-1 receptor homology (TIR) domain [Arabidopsis thaliana x Arabidopsis arenosa]|uniref:Toll/interleukin-1 receptor homology (TIR) domain n=1 Tax=Arabidopsis thaliana x Arabidopsis arenosa TaxID=1240361 RepID=A0A8T1XNP8_9BRAS|nr:Toll/interleukin-1 receptor homology (TIR) domain [Arabidopsis thaliana x Arabidopsis arenosa]
MEEKEQSPPQHQVFINFRGKKLRNNFISRLVDALNDSGIKVVTDPGEDEGQDINNVFKRIEDSRIALVVFSSRYTKSRWCLDELAKIKERQDQGMLKVLPIFYKVMTSNVKQLKGDFGKHFWDQERKCKASRMKKWKKALEFVSGNIGLRWDTESSESSFIGSIVSNVLKLLDKISSTEQTAKYQPNHLFEQEETSSRSILAAAQETKPRKSISFNVGGSSLANPTNVSQLRSVPSEIYHGNQEAWHGLSSGSSRGKSLALYDNVSGQYRLKWLARLGLRSSLPEDNSLAPPKTNISGFGWPALQAPYRTKTPHGWTTSSFTTGLADGPQDVPPLRDIFNMGQHADSAYARGNPLVYPTIQSRPGIQLGYQAYSMDRSNPDTSSNAYTNHNAQYGDLSDDFSYLWNPLVGVRTAPIQCRSEHLRGPTRKIK